VTEEFYLSHFFVKLLICELIKNMEKAPEFRIIGGASPEKKEQAKKEVEQALFNQFESISPQDREQLEKLEYPKSEKELAFIDFANKETDELMKEAGMDPYDIPAENYHIVPPELYTKVHTGTATTAAIKQGIVFNAQYFRDNPVTFGASALHETLHLKGHFSLEVEEEGEKVKKTPYREGVTVRALQRHGFHGKYHRHFDGLHEAIVATQEKKLLGKLLELPELTKEKEWLMSDEAKELRKKVAENEEIPEDDILWVGKKGKNDWASVSYSTQRQVLDYVCTKIQKEFPDQYQSADEVFKEFLKAHFTGQLLPIARLVEKTFGEGSFRLFGNMDHSEESGVLHLESLKKARARATKQS